MAIWIPNLQGRRGPKYLQIVEAMAEDIASGQLPVGTRLPPQRELAYQLGLSPNTTSRAYSEGVNRALLRGEVGRGTFVRAPGARPQAGEVGDLWRPTTGPVDLSRNLPIPGLAEPHVRRVLGEIVRGTELPSLLDHQTDRDSARLDDAVSAWFQRCGLHPESEESVVTNGAQHGLLCSLMALFRPGDLLLLETLTYAPVRAMADRLGIKTLSVAMDANGLVPEAFEELCRRAAPKALYVQPTLQSPTTATLSAVRRQAIADVAERFGVLLIEDDVFGPLKRDRPDPIAALAPTQTIYVTSLSKCVAPGLRIGFLRAPRNLAPALRHAVSLSVWMTAPMTLEVAASLVLDGTAEMLTAQQQTAALKRQRLARSILNGHDYAADPHGLHIWLPLPEGWRADSFRSACADNKVLVTEGREFADRAAAVPEAIRICLSHEASDQRVARGLQKIADLLRSPPLAADVVV